MNQILDFGAGGGNDNNDNRKIKKEKPVKQKEKLNNFNNYNNYNNDTLNSGNSFNGNTNTNPNANVNNNSFAGNDFDNTNSFVGGKTYNKGGFKSSSKNLKDTLGYNGVNSGIGGKANKVKTAMSDKVVKVFAGLLILLAIALIASGATSIMKNKGDEKASKTATTTDTGVDATINAELDQVSGEVTITVESTVPISKMIYSWDQDHDNVVAGESQTSLTETVNSRSGEHVLHIQVTDEQNHKTTKDFTFDSATGVDTSKPDITLTVTEDKKLSIKATDDTSIAYVTYTWNQDETVTMTPDSQDQKEYDFEIDIPKGENTITVVAVDGSSMGNAKSVTQVFTGVTKPQITCGFLDSTGKTLKVMCSHENGIQSIKYTFNGQEYSWENPEGQDPQTYLEFTQDSIPGTNTLLCTVTSTDGTSEELNVNWDYNVAPTSDEQETPSENETTDSQETTNNQETSNADTTTTDEEPDTNN